MSEIEFLEKIDCEFPYHSTLEWQTLTKLGASISPNAAFAVLHEICRPPISKKNLTYETKRLMIDYWSANFEHPIKDIVLIAAEFMIRDLTISVKKSMEIMVGVSHYQNQYAALSIPYFACDDVHPKFLC